MANWSYLSPIVFFSFCRFCFTTESNYYGENYPVFRMDERGQIVTDYRRGPSAIMITPIRAIAAFHNKSGFITGFFHGNVSFYQANFPNQQASLINIRLEFPKIAHDRNFRLEILHSGDVSSHYCTTGKRWYKIADFVLKAGKSVYMKSIKVHDLSVTNAIEGILGRGIRLSCSNCESQKLVGCTVIGRLEDEVYREEGHLFRDRIMIVRNLVPRNRFT